MRAVLLVLFFFCHYLLQAQTMERWSNLVKWDGVTSWQNYMIYSADFMGPNALPIPAMANGSVDSLQQLGFAFVSHISKGDKTQNLKLYANYCLVKNLISADVSWIPMEYFRVSPEIKDKRHVYPYFYNDYRAAGDIYFNVNLQLLNRWRNYFHLALRTGYRFPTSSSVGSARYTDVPGYHFDLSAAKPLSDQRLKLTAMIGFYVWQLNTSGQDDALLYGVGLEYHHQGWHYQLNCRGYSGYRHNGDHPLSIESNLEKRVGNFSMVFNLYKGLRDYGFISMGLGVKYIFGKQKHGLN